MLKSTLATLSILVAAAFPATAGLKVEITNQLSEAGLPPEANPNTGATPGQFGAATLTAGGLSHQVADGSTTPITPAATSSRFRLARAVVGPAFAAGVPDFAFGEVITPPDPSGWRAAPVAPGEMILTPDGLQTPVPADTVVRYYYSPHAEQVFATESGGVEIVWRSALANSNGEFTIEPRSHIVSPVPVKSPRRIFWTEVPANGPVVPLPAGIEDVHIAYRELFPATIPDPTASDPGSAPQVRTFWLDELPGSKTFRAQLLEGRLFVEFLGEQREPSTGARFSLGTEVVDVLAEPVPGATSFVVTAYLGDRLKPSNGDTNLIADVRRGLAQSPPFVANRQVGDTPAVFAERITTAPNDVLVVWKQRGLLGTEWPVFRNSYQLVWPGNLTEYVINALPARGDGATVAVDLKSENTPTLVFQDTDGEAEIDVGHFRVDLATDGDGMNLALLLFQTADQFFYQRVASLEYTAFPELDSRYPSLNAHVGTAVPPTPAGLIAAEATVGERILPPTDGDAELSPAPHIHRPRGDAYNPHAYLDPLEAGFAAAELSSAVIPVNALPANNQLVLFWYEKVLPPTADFEPIYWPSVVGGYAVSWPTDPREIVMASNAGTGELTASEAAGAVYWQNDPAAPGYNPNEEHALMLAGRGYALRDDLNVAGVSSLPFVLIEYVDADELPSMSVFRVLREKPSEGITFDYGALAGTRVGGPAPLSLLPVPINPATGLSPNEEVIINDPDAGDVTPGYYDRFTFQDRKGESWIYRGPHGPGGTGALQMRFYYDVQPGFAFPDATTGVDLGASGNGIEPYLRAPDGGGGYLDRPIDITFTPVWPEVIDPTQPELDDPDIPNAPVLEFADTLTNPKFGLPAVRGQTSARIIYEQSRALDPAGNLKTAVLFDPTRAKTYRLSEGGLAKIPSDIATDSRNGRTYFQLLPPHLKERFYFDPNIGPLGALVLLGEFVDEVIGEDYLLLNVLSGKDLLAIQDLSIDNAWKTAATNLTTGVETFVENPAVPGTYIPGSTFLVGSQQLAVVTESDQAVDSYALTSVGGGSGYVSLIFGDGEAFTPEGEPVTVAIIHVGGGLHPGMVRPLLSSNPLDEQVTLRHSGDFAGRPQDYEFEWRYQPPINGLTPPLDPLDDNAGSGWIVPNGSPFENQFIVKGTPPLLSLGDNYWTMRFRPVDPNHPVRRGGAAGWSTWTAPALVEGWIKRALAGINPFNQRITDFFNNGINTDVSILTQAGTRWEGDIALNLANIDEFGLIEIYETILNRGIGISIGGSPATDYGPANDALLLASGYLADLYTILGDEAFADASNPTIAFDAQAIGSVADSSIAVDFASVFQETATARFAFQGQTASLLEEELRLLLGRDDSTSPGVELSPVYNRLIWNYTRGITAGEVIYALNYNIRERAEDDANGTVNAEDAARQYPQGHGDAYGHYLTATTNYYRLLTNPNFSWAPRVEAVNVLGVPVQVDYFDERKFATAASRTAKTALQVSGLVHRQTHTDDRSQGWAHFRDGTNPNENFRDGRQTSSERVRHWGLDEWATRGTQGAYFNWVVANSLLPDEDTVNTGIQKIDRTTVPELAEIASTADALQAAADKANAFLNPLGLSARSQLFDINPTELAAGKTHFEQVFERTTAALNNAFDTFDQATASTRLLRSLENQADDLTAAVFDQEAAFTGQLREIYGSPYAGDIGVGKTYPQGYSGPDLLRFFYVDEVSLVTDPFPSDPVTYTLELPVDYMARNYLPTNPEEVSRAGAVATELLEFTINPESPVQYATPSMGRRQSVGQIQIALQEVGARREDLDAAFTEYSRGREVFTTELRIFNEAIAAYENSQQIATEVRDDINQIGIDMAGIQAGISSIDGLLESYLAFSEATSEGIPDIIGVIVGTSNGTITDIDSIPDSLASYGEALAITAAGFSKFALETSSNALEVDATFLENNLGIRLEAAGFPAEYLRMAADLQEAYYEWYGASSGIDQALFALSQARTNYRNLVAEGARLQASREVFRRRAAAAVQGYRTRDVAFRAFRTEALEQYQTLLDWAARYTYLAAKAYDYETGLLQSPEGMDFLNAIVASRALGLRNEQGDPIFGASETGDPGLSGLLAQLSGDWSAVNGRLGFNNPDENGTVFSLRHELFRIPEDTPSTDGDTNANNDSVADRTWSEQIQSLIVPDIRRDADVATHCLQIDTADTPIPGIIIPFSSTISRGLNFFGRPLAGGDHAFSTTNFATKVHGVGTIFTGYVGMDPYAVGTPGAGGPATSDPNALSATPYVYLIPTGEDVLRTPPLGGGVSTLRSYGVQDFAMPLPFNIGAIPISPEVTWTGNETLDNGFLVPRKHQAFRATDDPAFFFSAIPGSFTNQRLVGRSAWNTGWKLVIPAETLLNNPSDGLNRFLQSVTDIKLYLRTYSYSGN